MGELCPGDWLFSDKGTPSRVIQTFAVETPAASYRLTFDDGSQIDAGGEHKWLTFDAKELSALTRHDPEWRARRRAKRESRVTGIKSAKFIAAIIARNKANPPRTLPTPTGTVRTTDEIYRTLYSDKGRTNHAIPVAEALDLPKADLLLDPYCLGAWLGDGSRGGGRFTGTDAEILLEFEQGGFQVSHHRHPQSHGILGICKPLREIGVLKRKHVPDVYLRGSKAQRLALLQGLMDTDGTVCESGSVEFTNTNRLLIDSAYELITSLGWKARVVEGRATLKGKDCGPKWDIKWTPSEYVFRLSRKRDRQRLATRRTTKFRYVVDCRPVPSIPMRCILVDSPSHLYLAGRQMVPTHNTDALLMAALQYVDVPGYSALLLMKSFSDLSKPGALMDRAAEWLTGSGAIWHSLTKSWEFPNAAGKPASLSFGYLQNDADKYNYRTAEYQFIGIDELTRFLEKTYTYLFSRLRRLKTAAHVPIRMRSASNPAQPGEPGMEWVEARFIPEDFDPKAEALQAPRVLQKEGTDDRTGRILKRCFVFARLEDNPHLDAEEYELSLSELDAVSHAQLREGDWKIRQRGDIYWMFDPRYVFVPWSRWQSVIGVRQIPDHWFLTVSQDQGTSDEHIGATGWFATAAKNSPLNDLVAMYRALMVVEQSPTEVGDAMLTRMGARAQSLEEINADLLPDRFGGIAERSRVNYWLNSHEAKSERLEYRKMGINFQSWTAGPNIGIAQMRDYLAIIDRDKANPFFPDLMGRSRFVCIVPDEDWPRRRTGSVWARIEAEFAAYHYKTLTTGEPTASSQVVPHPLFNDFMDVIRAAAYTSFPRIAPLTDKEIIEAKLPKSIKIETIKVMPEGEEKHRAIQSHDFWSEELSEDDEKEQGRFYLDQSLTRKGG